MCMYVCECGGMCSSGRRYTGHRCMYVCIQEETKDYKEHERKKEASDVVPA